MYIRVIGLFSFTEILLSILAQAELMPESLFSLFAQIPLVAVIVWLWLQTDKRQREDNEKSREWLEHMINVQRESIKEIYATNMDFLNTLLNTLMKQIDAKQSNMSDRIELLTQIIAEGNKQLGINTSTVGELLTMEAIVSELIDRLERK